MSLVQDTFFGRHVLSVRCGSNSSDGAGCLLRWVLATMVVTFVLFNQLHCDSKLKTPKDQPRKRRRAPSKRLRYAETKLLQILRRYTVLDIPRGDFGIQFQWPLMALETIKGQIFP